jgi:hypothetical protein
MAGVIPNASPTNWGECPTASASCDGVGIAIKTTTSAIRGIVSPSWDTLSGPFSARIPGCEVKMDLSREREGRIKRDHLVRERERGGVNAALGRSESMAFGGGVGGYGSSCTVSG